MSQVREEIRQRRQEYTEKIARAQLGEESSSARSFSQSQESPEQHSNHHITFYAPQHVAKKGGESILLNVEPVITSKVFCRFNLVVVAGWLTVNHSLMCRVPPLDGDEVILSVSADTIGWSAPVSLKIDRESNDVIWVVGAVIIVVAGLVLKNTVFRKKRMQKKENSADFDEILDAGELKERDVRRRPV
jgi:hypothetical protein